MCKHDKPQTSINCTTALYTLTNATIDLHCTHSRCTSLRCFKYRSSVILLQSVSSSTAYAHILQWCVRAAKSPFSVQETNWLTHLCAVHPGSDFFRTSNPLWCDVILKKGYLQNIAREAKILNMMKHCNIVKITGLIMTDEILPNGKPAAFMAMAEHGVPLTAHLQTNDYRCPFDVASSLQVSHC